MTAPTSPASSNPLAQPTTWITVLTIVAACLSDVFHRSFAAYVAPAATLAAGAVLAAVTLAHILGRYHVAATVTAATALAASGPPAAIPAAPTAPAVPPGPPDTLQAP